MCDSLVSSFDCASINTTPLPLYLGRRIFIPDFNTLHILIPVTQVPCQILMPPWSLSYYYIIPSVSSFVLYSLNDHYPPPPTIFLLKNVPFLPPHIL